MVADGKKYLFFSGQNVSFGSVDLGLVVCCTPPGAGQCGCIVEATPRFLILGEVGGLMEFFYLRSRAKKGKTNFAKKYHSTEYRFSRRVETSTILFLQRFERPN